MKISSEQLKQLRKKVKLTQEEAAHQLGISLRQYVKYEANPDSKTYKEIPQNLLELFCLKNKTPFPPIDQQGRLLVNKAKIISFTNEKGGVAKTSLSFDIARILQREGKKILLIGEETSSVFYFQNKSNSSQFPCPEMLNVKEIHFNFEDRVFLGGREEKKKYKFADLVTKYDFIFFDIICAYERVPFIADLLIFPTPFLPMDFQVTRDTVEKMRKLHPEVNAAILIIKKETHRYDNSIEEIDWDNEEQEEQEEKMSLDDYRKALLKRAHEDNLSLKELQDLSLPVFDSFLTTAYEVQNEVVYEFSSLDPFDHPSNMADKAPESWAVKEMVAVKNEICRRIDEKRLSGSVKNG